MSETFHDGNNVHFGFDDDDFDDYDYDDYGEDDHTCPRCGGSGLLMGDPAATCDHCDGEGFEWWLP